MIRASEHFRSDDRRRHSEWLRQQRWFIKAREDRHRRVKAEERAEDDLASLATDAVMATEVQMRAFETRLDRYDEATIVALMENRELLDRLYAERDALLAQAYVMEDGRRVFKSEDGSFVIDEFGNEVSGDELDPDLIGEQHPAAELFLANDAAILEAEEAQTRLHEFQAKVEDARDELADGEMSAREMDDLDAELLDLMPASIRDHAVVEPASPESGLTSSFSAPSRDGTAPDAQHPAPAGGTGPEMQFTPGG